MSSFKIVVLGTRGFPRVQGGVEKHCEQLYPRLVALGCEVIALSRAPYTGLAPYQYQGVTIIPLPCPRQKFLEAIFHTFLGVLKAKKLRADIVHIHGIGPSLFVPFARMIGLKVVMTHHGPDYERKKWPPFAKWVLKLGETWGVKGAHEVIVISEVIARQINEKYRRVATVIPNGVVISVRAESDATLEKFSLERGKYVLAVGRLVPEKGWDDLIESFGRCAAAATGQWKLVVAGDADHADTYAQAFKEKASRLPRVVLTGFQPESALRELYSHAGLFVLPSYYEGLPIALLEALSYGCSCIVSDIPTHREMGLAEERYFKPGDIKRMAQKIDLFANRPTSETERRAWIQQISTKYDWADITRKTIEVYKQVLRA